MVDHRTIEGWKWARQQCRTNLLFLCHILDYKDVSARVHGGILNNVQKFTGGTDNFDPPKSVNGLKPGQLALGRMCDIVRGYTSTTDMWQLAGSRQYLNMIPRGHLKTSVITFTHAIQWVINYPNVRILLNSHTDANVRDFLNEIKKQFTNNGGFRYLFPEHVPWGKAVDKFGNQEFFDTCARTKWTKEHTFNILSVGSASAGPHYDVIFYDDLVDKENVKTPMQIQVVKDHMAACDPLVHRQNTPSGPRRGWEYLTGTFYDCSDLNYFVYESESQKANRIWSLNVQSAAPNYPEGPTLWPERFPIEALKEIEHDPAKGPAMLAAQYLMNPVPPGTGLVDSKDEIIWTPRKVLNDLYARLSLHVAVDLAGMDEAAKGRDNDYTAITLGGFGTDGHLYILEIIHGRPKPEVVINELFALAERHPRLRQIKVEKEAHARVLLPFLKREEQVRRRWLPIVAVPRDNQQSKKQKIKGLQPWLKRGMIHFPDDSPYKIHVINEIMRFPKYDHDDILDTIYDLFMERDGQVTGDVLPSEKALPERPSIIKQPDGTWLVQGDPARAAEEYVFGITPDDTGYTVDPLTGM